MEAAAPPLALTELWLSLARAGGGAVPVEFRPFLGLEAADTRGRPAPGVLGQVSLETEPQVRGCWPQPAACRVPLVRPSLPHSTESWNKPEQT